MSTRNLNIIGLLVCAYFMAIEIIFDFGSEAYQADYLHHWFLPLAFMIFVLMFCFWQLSEYGIIKLMWWFFLSCAGNWFVRLYCYNPHKINWNEYVFAGIFLIGIPLQMWWHNYKNRR